MTAHKMVFNRFLSVFLPALVAQSSFAGCEEKLNANLYPWSLLSPDDLPKDNHGYFEKRFMEARMFNYTYAWEQEQIAAQRMLYEDLRVAATDEDRYAAILKAAPHYPDLANESILSLAQSISTPSLREKLIVELGKYVLPFPNRNRLETYLELAKYLRTQDLKLQLVYNLAFHTLLDPYAIYEVIHETLLQSDERDQVIDRYLQLAEKLKFVSTRLQIQQWMKLCNSLSLARRVEQTLKEVNQNQLRFVENFSELTRLLDGLGWTPLLPNREIRKVEILLSPSKETRITVNYPAPGDAVDSYSEEVRKGIYYAVTHHLNYIDPSAVVTRESEIREIVLGIYNLNFTHILETYFGWHRTELQSNDRVEWRSPDLKFRINLKNGREAVQLPRYSQAVKEGILDAVTSRKSYTQP